MTTSPDFDKDNARKDERSQADERAVERSASGAGDDEGELSELLSEEDRKLITNPKYRWYIVNTYSGSEETVKLALKERIVRAGLEDSFGEIFVPKMVVEKVLKSGKKKLVDKTSFPGYVMVQM